MTDPVKPAARYIVHALGLALCIAGVVAWARLLQPPAPAVPSAQARETRADPAAEALGAWFGPGELRANVVVKGLIKGEAQGVAVLSVNDAAARAYRVGDTLARSVTLKAVEADAVRIDKAGVVERIAAPVLPQPATPGIARAVR